VDIEQAEQIWIRFLWHELVQPELTLAIKLAELILPKDMSKALVVIK
jgi:hypothetical protein